MKLTQLFKFVLITFFFLPLCGSAQHDCQNMTLLSRWPYGDCRTAFAKDNYVCINNGSVMEILDISNPSQAVKIGEIITESIISHIFISGNFAYLANWSKGIRIIDISNPATPQEASFIEFEGQCWHVSVFDNYAYVGNDTLGLRIVDVHDPYNPVLKGTFKPAGNFLGAEFTQVVGTTAYTASKSGLYIIDVSDPANPALQSFVFSSTGSFHVHVAGNIAYLSEFANGIKMIDVTNPEQPEVLGYYETPGHAYWMEVIDSYAYIADLFYGLYVVDISDPAEPDSVTILDSDGAYAFNIIGNSLFLADGSGLKLFDITDKQAPEKCCSYDVNGYCYGVYVKDKYAYIAAQYGLVCLDLNNPAAPEKIDRIPMRGATFIRGSDDYIYVLDNGQLHIFDISDPHTIEEVGLWATGYIASLCVSDKIAYLTGYPSVRIIDISDLNNIFEMGSTYVPGNNISVFGADRYIYLANGSSGLRIVDVKTPAEPNEVGTFEDGDYIADVYVKGHFAYIADRFIGLLRVLDVSNPENPVEVSSIHTGEVRYLCGSHDYVYAVNPWEGVRVIDVSNPYDVSEVGYFNTNGFTRDLCSAGDMVYVADGAGGICILKNNLISGFELENKTQVYSFELKQNYPNPFNPTTTIEYQLAKTSRVDLSIYNLLGQKIATLVSEKQQAGSYKIEWDASGFSSGVYFYRLEAELGFTRVRKLIVIK